MPSPFRFIFPEETYCRRLAASVNSALARARARLADVAPSEDDVAEPDDAGRRELLDRYCAAFENADLAALTELLQTR